VHVVWGDSELAPSSSDGWPARRSRSKAPVCSGTDKLKKDLLRRASELLKVDAAKLQMKDGVITSTEDPRRNHVVELVKLNKGVIRQEARGVDRNQGRALSKGVGACFAEVEVDTWTVTGSS